MPSLDDLLKSNEPKITEGYEPSSVHSQFVTGAAGSGKTFNQKKAIEDDPNYGVLCSTTGISAINLGSTTLNSVLRYFDTESLRDKFNRGQLTSALHKIGRKVKRLVIDEVSMMDGRQLDYIFNAMEQCNRFQDMEKTGPMGIVLTGDMCQLPPIKCPWAFDADCWEHFERNTTRLTKVWRQDNLEFVEALNAARAGQGGKCVEILRGLGVKFVPSTIKNFKGTTIMSKNDQVDNFNFSALMELPGEAYGLKTGTWGDQSGEWKNIPEILKLKDGAFVMILSNDPSGQFEYANGDQGYIQQRDADGTLWIKLTRNEKVVPIRPIIRHKVSRGDDIDKDLLRLFPGESIDYGQDLTHLFCDQQDCGRDGPGLRYGTWGRPTFNCQSGSVNTGAIKYYPLRLAYATTVHKSQGLTLDACQIDCRDIFFGSPQMAYVALSRCRTADGLTIVGDALKLEQRIKLEPKIRRWL